MTNDWMVETGLVKDWLLELDDKSYVQVIAAIELLQEYGPGLGRPVVDSVVGSRHKNMKELRPGSSGRSELRVLFAFDPGRMAVLLAAGDKAGRWQQWYRLNIPIADDRLDRHLAQLRERGRGGNHG